MVKRGNIDLRSDQWNAIGEACVLLGRIREPTKMERLFATLNIAAAALSHIEHGAKYPVHKLAFPLELRTYQTRFKSKDCVLRLHDFKCNQSCMKTDLTPLIFDHILNAYEAHINWEGKKKKAGCAPGTLIKHLTREQFRERLLHCGSFCHHYISYNPTHSNLEQAYQRCQEFYRDNWESFQETKKTTPNEKLVTLKTKFPQFKEFMMKLGIKRWLGETLSNAEHDYLTETKGRMGGFLIKYEDEEYMLDLMEAFLKQCAGTKFLPTPPSRDYLSGVQQWLREKATARNKHHFGWLNTAELSEDFYDLELAQEDAEAEAWETARAPRLFKLDHIIRNTPAWVHKHQVPWKKRVGKDKLAEKITLRQSKMKKSIGQM